MSRFEFISPTGCHQSTYSVTSAGYAQIGWQPSGESNKGTTAHRAAWTAVYGPIPDGLTVDHLCKNRRCVNVEHLRLLTNFENARRTHGRDWPIGNGECINGHSAASYVHGVDTTHSNGFCRECFPELSWTIKERSSK